MAMLAFVFVLFSGQNEAHALIAIPPSAFELARQQSTRVRPRQDATESTLQLVSLTSEPMPSASRLSGVLTQPIAMPEPFDTDLSAVSDGGIFQKWTKVETGLRAERRILQDCRNDAVNCPPAARRFLAIIEEGRQQTGLSRIDDINRAINLSIVPKTDLAVYGVIEYWATPLTMFAHGAGDCEDYAIGKFVALREAGVPAADLRLVVVRNNAMNDYHAVAAVREAGRWLILDNLTYSIREDSSVGEFKPLFVIGDAGVKRVEGRVSASAELETSGLSELKTYKVRTPDQSFPRGSMQRANSSIRPPSNSMIRDLLSPVI